LQSEVLQEVEALLDRGAVAELDFEALEMALRHGTLRLAACALEQRLKADTSDELDSRIPCRCGGEAQFAGEANSSTACSGRCVCSVPTIAVPLVVAVAVPAINI
jgi:hypothetical protein